MAKVIVTGNVVVAKSYELDRVELNGRVQTLTEALVQALKSGTLRVQVRDDASPAGRFKAAEGRDRGNVGLTITGTIDA